MVKALLHSDIGKTGLRRSRLKQLWPALAMLAFILALLCVPHAASGLAASQEPDQPVPASFFAMNILFHPLNHVPWPVVPLGGWRTSHVNWADLQPEKTRWYFDLLDKYADWSVAHHTEILMPLTYTPRWASSTPDAPTDVEAGNPPGLSGAPRDMEDWRIFIRTVATRYKGRIRNWEIWNEPNRPQSWTGNVDTMVEMTREAAKILKEIDPGCVIVSPAPTGTYGLPFLDKFLSKGGGQYVDVIGYHFYVGRDNPPESMVSLINSVKATASRYGLASKPIWNTEAGWLGPQFLPPDVDVAYLARAYILNWASGVTRFYWYAWENHHGTEIELVQKDNVTLTPAGQAFATLQTWMTGATMSRCANSTDGTWICDLHSHTGVGHIVWNTKGTTTFSIPNAWHANSIDALDGTQAAVQGSSISLGIEPVLIP